MGDKVCIYQKLYKKVNLQQPEQGELGGCFKRNHIPIRTILTDIKKNICIYKPVELYCNQINDP